MSDRPVLRWATTSARVVIGTIVAVVAVAATSLVVTLPWPRLEATPVRLVATPAPSDTVLACDGPLLVLGRSAQEAGGLSLAAPQQVITGPADTASTSATLAAPAGADPVAVTAPPVERVAAPLAAAGSSSVEAADLRGFAASACRPPLMESWLVGGASTTGANDLVVLSNPGEVAATVQLTVFGAMGPQTPPGGSDLVIPPGAQRVVPLAGLLLGEESPVTRVSASGAPVRASLQASVTRLLTPGGVEQVSPVAEATAQQVIPGVTVTARDADASGATAIVRILSPSADASATVSAVPTGGAATQSFDVPLVTGVPSELDLSTLPAGQYSLVVDANAPVVASAWQTAGSATAADFAWSASAPQLDAATLFAVPAGAGSTLTLANVGTDAVTVDLVALADPGAGATQVAVPAGASVAVPLTGGAVYRLEPSGPVHAEVSFASEGALAAFPLWAADAAAQPIVVYP